MDYLPLPLPPPEGFPVVLGQLGLGLPDLLSDGLQDSAMQLFSFFIKCNLRIQK